MGFLASHAAWTTWEGSMLPSLALIAWFIRMLWHGATNHGLLWFTPTCMVQCYNGVVWPHKSPHHTSPRHNTPQKDTK